MTTLLWATHPRHLPKPPAGTTVVLDVAFAASSQWKTKTRPFIDSLGSRLLRWVDHHEHREGWPCYAADPRFLLVPNRQAHACPELVTAELVASVPVPDVIVAHRDFDGVISAAKWLRRGREPWEGADEDARAIDSPGRGHHLTEVGARIASALDEASARFERREELEFASRVTRAIVAGERDPALEDEIDTLAQAARAAEDEARKIVEARGRLEAPGVFVVRMDAKQENRMRRNLLVFAEERAPIGALFEPDPQGGAWLTAATFDERFDLEEVQGFEGGRSDYRFARAHHGGEELVEALSRYAVATTSFSR